MLKTLLSLRRTMAIIIVFGLGPVVHAADAGEVSGPAKILEGYGKTQWGQTSEQVIETVGAMDRQEESEHRVNCYKKEKEGPITETRYEFIDDQLHRVKVTYELPDRPETGQDTEGLEIITEIVKKKYAGNDEIKGMLGAARIYIRVDAGNDGRIYITYENAKAAIAATKAIEERKRLEQLEAARERQRSPRYKKIRGLDLGEDI